MGQASSDSTAHLKQRCRQIIDGFAHRAVLREDDIREWIAHVVGQHGEAAPWHATRASGFGGSDIGVLVRNFNGVRADHMNSAHDIVMAKLLRDVPSEETGDLRRGHENEPRHAQAFYAKYGAQRDEAAFDGLCKAQGLRTWMRYSPDEVALLPADAPNPALGGLHAIRVLGDYKAPRVVEDDDEISFQYACQLHQGAMICAKHGIHLDALMLSQFDWANWALKDDYVPYDPQLARMILQAGDHYHGFVMRGELPPYIMTPRFEDEAAFVEKYGDKAQRLAQLRATQQAFEVEADKVADELKAALSTTRLAGKRMSLGDLGITAVNLVDHVEVVKLVGPEEAKSLRKKGAKASYDTDAMAAKLKELGVDPAVFRVDPVDSEKAYARLLELGHDPEALMVQQIRFKVSDFLKNAAADLVQQSFPRPKAETTDSKDGAEPPVDAQPMGAGDDVEAQQDVREGQTVERLAPRTAMA